MPHVTLCNNTNLVGGWTNPFEKYAQVKLDHETPGIRDENKECLKFHHPEIFQKKHNWVESPSQYQKKVVIELDKPLGSQWVL